MAFIALIQIELHFPEAGDLKAKRKELKSLKALIQQRCRAAVAETNHHDLWQRASLVATVVARDRGGVGEQADAVRRLVLGRHPDGASVTATVVSVTDLVDG
jgi:uncharacterized protein YlxP (DUF503 family)